MNFWIFKWWHACMEYEKCEHKYASYTFDKRMRLQDCMKTGSLSSVSSHFHKNNIHYIHNTMSPIINERNETDEMILKFKDAYVMYTAWIHIFVYNPIMSSTTPLLSSRMRVCLWKCNRWGHYGFITFITIFFLWLNIYVCMYRQIWYLNLLLYLTNIQNNLFMK